MPHLDTGHILGEAFILLADLKGQLPGVAHDQDRYLWSGQERLMEGSVLNPSRPKPIPTRPPSKGAHHPLLHTWDH